MEKWQFLPPPGLEIRLLGRPARSQSLYRLPWVLEVKYLQREADHSLLSSAEFKNVWSFISAPLYSGAEMQEQLITKRFETRKAYA
jgi:hypothetical protein